MVHTEWLSLFISYLCASFEDYGLFLFPNKLNKQKKNFSVESVVLPFLHPHFGISFLLPEIRISILSCFRESDPLEEFFFHL